MTEMSTERTGSKSTSFSRRKLAQGAAWAVPAAAVSAAAPAYASSKFSYTIGGSVFMGYGRYGACTNGQQVLTYLNFNNMTPPGNYPAGFSVMETPRIAGTTSPRTTATLTRYDVTIYVPTAWVNTGVGRNGWISDSAAGDSNWSGPYMGTAGYLEGVQYTPYTFRFNITSQTKSASTSPGTNPTPWPGSATLQGHFAIRDVCVPNGASYYWSYVRGFTTANGDSFSQSTTGNPIKQPMIY